MATMRARLGWMVAPWAALAVLVLVGGCSRAPQLGGDEDCLAATDALWTAVTSKRPELLQNCTQEIARLHDMRQMPDDAFETLSKIIVSAQSGQWADARNSLKTFIRRQRPAASSGRSTSS